MFCRMSLSTRRQRHVVTPVTVSVMETFNGSRLPLPEDSVEDTYGHAEHISIKNKLLFLAFCFHFPKHVLLK